MDTILVATDFSARSDLAIRRAALMARAAGAGLHLTHVVDDDQKARIIESETTVSKQLLQEEAAELNHQDGLNCTSSVVLGDPFEGIGNAADQIAPDLVVIGAHRRRLLRNVFVGTTAQRTIRRAQWPVLMVNAPPQRTYDNVLIATDLSETSRRAVAHFSSLDLVTPEQCTLLHVFDAPAKRLLMSGMLQEEEKDQYLVELQIEADSALRDFADASALRDAMRMTRHYNTATSAAIQTAATEIEADLIVVASQGRVGLSKTFLGSVAEEVLRRAETDVLAIPPTLLA
ncbi:universal stress protein [Roseovarius dicentrarchi]|uniref:universal stress protein n=1 Tax=Roseovarius dicentrarchi TaxID=2250573 RepID=UPI000DE8F7FF|nr:universal stress protein [Roseovarius dicentrarchi]